ncbi:hypothetical protein RJ640_024101, partial [Escallonia rubra]
NEMPNKMLLLLLNPIDDPHSLVVSPLGFLLKWKFGAFSTKCFFMIFLIWVFGQKGFLDDQFVQLQKLQDESNPDFVIEVVSLFFEDSEKLLNNLATALQQHIVDYKQVDALVHQFKGSSSRMLACPAAFLWIF